MTYNFSKVLLHFIRVSVSVGEPSPISHLWLFVFKNPDLWSSLDAGFPKSVDIVYILWTQASFSPLPSWSCEVISSAAKVFPTQISMTCWKLTSRISLCLKFAPTLEVPHLWEVSFQLVGSWRTGLPVACSTPLCLESCAVWISSFYELCLLLPRQGQFDKWIRTERERKAELQKQEEIPDEHKAAGCCSRKWKWSRSVVSDFLQPYGL